MWFPLESNPDVMNRYLRTLGVTEPKVQFVDVYGVSDDLLSMVPTPVHAVLLVYPLCRASEERIAAQQAAQSEEVAALQKAQPFFFTRQYVPNACGTIAIAHALLNNRDKLGELDESGILAATTRMQAEEDGDPQSIGKRIAEDESLASAHAVAAQEGATENQDIEADINLHFVCFIHVGGRCVELDGRKPNPTLHGMCDTNAAFLQATAAAIAERMALNPDAYEFGITALVNA